MGAYIRDQVLALLTRTLTLTPIEMISHWHFALHTHNQLHNYIPKIIEIIDNYVIGSLRPGIEISNLKSLHLFIKYQQQQHHQQQQQTKIA